MDVLTVGSTLFRLMGHDVVIQVYPFKRSLEMLKQGAVDGIFTIFKNPEREEFTLYSKEVIVLQSITLWVRKDSVITSANDFSAMQKYRFGVIRGISYGDKFDTLEKAGKLNVDTANNVRSVMEMLLTNRFDIWVCNHFGAIYELKKAGLFDAVKELSPPLQEQLAYVGFSKKRNLDKLRDQFDKTLQLLKRNGFYDAVLEKYARGGQKLGANSFSFYKNLNYLSPVIYAQEITTTQAVQVSGKT